MTPQQVRDDTLYQVGAMYAFVRAAGATLHHVKPHGALNTAVAETSDEHAEALVEATQVVRRGRCRVIAIAGSRLHRAAQRLGQPVVAEGFPDRAYAARRLARPPGQRRARSSTTPTSPPRAPCGWRATGPSRRSTAPSSRSTPGTLCIHGDNPGSVATARAIRAALEREGIAIAAF